jgi:cysteine desulfuration protein SufE
MDQAIPPSPPSIAARMAHLEEEFAQAADWDARYRLIIARGRRLPDMASAAKTEANRVRGCASTVWLHAQLDDQGRVVYEADSDAVLVRGLIAMLLEVYSQHRPAEILAHPPTFIERVGLNVSLSPNRASGLSAMVKQIMIYAMAFQARSSMPPAPPTAAGRMPSPPQPPAPAPPPPRPA